MNGVFVDRFASSQYIALFSGMCQKSNGRWNRMNLAIAFAQVISILFLLLGLFIVYLIIRTAINHSELNKNVQALRDELYNLNHQIQMLLKNTTQDKNE
jgi:hypothetical protein